MSRKGVVEHKLGSNLAVLKLDWRQPIALPRVACAIGGLPSCVLAQLPAEPERWRASGALRN